MSQMLSKKFKMNSIVLVVIIITVLSVSFSAYALTASTQTSTSYRNKIANNWTYYARGYYENNCLAYALGNTTSWYWPWGSSNPTLTQVNSYLSGKGYTHNGNYNMSCDIYAYGSTSSVTHFSKGLGNGPLTYPIVAKWGHCEIFKHTSTSPYTSAVYGSRIASYVN